MEGEENEGADEGGGGWDRVVVGFDVGGEGDFDRGCFWSGGGVGGCGGFGAVMVVVVDGWMDGWMNPFFEVEVLRALILFSMLRIVASIPNGLDESYWTGAYVSVQNILSTSNAIKLSVQYGLKE